MRLALTLVPLLLFSGCLAAPANGDDDLASDDGTPDDAGTRQGVVFYDEAYQVLPNEPLEFTVQVPEGARNVQLEMSVSGAATPLDEALVSLSGCGQGYVSWNPGVNIVIGISGGGSWRAAELCSAAGSGSRNITIDTGATPMVGRLLLRSDVPA